MHITKLVKKIQRLRRKLRYWEYLYYIQSESKVSDEQYDSILEELHKLESLYPCLRTHTSPTQCIGNLLYKNCNKVYHARPMLSLKRIATSEKFLQFDKQLKVKLHKYCSISYCCELKIDGVAVSLLYKFGKLISAATRGNGVFGEDITNNILTIKSIPIILKKIDYKNNKLPFPYLVEIRGEVFISKSSFKKLNRLTIEKGDKPFSNSRNAASGSLRQFNTKVTSTRFLNFFCYGISYYDGDMRLLDSHWKRLQLCKFWGFPVNSNSRLIHDINQVLEYYYYIQDIRSSLELDIDGIVIKIDNCIDQNKLGSSFKAPNWAVAYKFPSEIKFTKIYDVLFQVGRTGIITPVACLEPITINNVRIGKVNLHNISEIKKFGLMIGDVVRIQRSGDVIPKMLDVVISKRTDNMRVVELPHSCPVCGSKLQTYHDQSIVRCIAGLSCLAQRKAIFQHFVSKQAMNIQGMGNKIISQLVDKNLVCTPVDFFLLNRSQLLSLYRCSMELANRLLRAIEYSKKTTLARFIYALGIRNVGVLLANNLALECGTLDNLMCSDVQSLLRVKCVGIIAAKNIYYFFKNSDNLKNIRKLIDPSIGIRLDSVI